MPTVNLTLTGQALSKVDDTNVTLTLGGTPLTALLKATSITVGWTGQLSVARGGTGLGALGTANQLLRVNALGTALEYFTPTYGSGTVTSVSVVSANGLAGTVANATTTPAITLSTSINSPVLAGNGTALIAATTTGSGSTVVLSTSPTFVTDISAPKIISSTASGGLLLCNNNGVTVASFGVGSAGSTNIALIGATAVTGTISGTSSLTLGTASTTVGSIVLNNATNANTITIQSGVTTSSHTLTLPVANASGVLTNNGSGTLTWAAASSGITVGTTTITSGTSRRIPYNLSGIYQEAAQELYFETASPYAHVFAAGRTGTISGVNNSAYGYQALKSLTSGTSNTAVGYQSLFSINTEGNYTALGATAGNQLTGGTRVVTIGAGSGSSVPSSVGYSVFLGHTALTSAGSGNFMVAIGHGATIGHSNSFVLTPAGADGTSETTATHQGIIGSNNASGYVDNIYFNGVSHSSPYSVVLHASHASGTNVSGCNITISGSAATGTGAGGNVKSTTTVKGSSGTTTQSDTDRHAIIGKYVDLTESAATTFANLALTTSGTTSGGTIIYAIEATDGTDYQNTSGRCNYSVVNKAGTLTFALSADTQSTAASAGTLTGTLSLAASGTTLQFQMNAVSSLAQTVLRISFQVLNQFGVATITAA